MKYKPLEGKIAEIIFDSGRHFRINFLAENKLRWTSIRKQDFGQTDVEDTHIEYLGDGLYAIDWIEKDGLCVSYSVDINASFVRSYMSWADEKGPFGGRDFLTHEGPFFFIKENGERDDTPFTNLAIAKHHLSTRLNSSESAASAKIISESVDKTRVFIETENSILHAFIVENNKVSSYRKFT